MSDDQKLYSTKQAAKFLGVSVRTLKYWRKSGKLVPDSQEETSAKFGRRLVQKYSLEQLRKVQNSRYVRQTQTLVQNSSGETFLQKQPQVANCYEQVGKRYTQTAEEIGITAPEMVQSPVEMVQNGQ